MMSDSERNRGIVRSFVDAINAQNWDALAAIVAIDFVRHSHAGGAPGVRSCDDLVRFLRGEFETFPDARESLLDLIAEGDKVAARHRFEGTQLGSMGPHEPSGKRMIAEYLAIYRFENGRIAEAWAEWDNLCGLRQLGHVPPAR